jgi:hypothetical protein
MVTAHDDCDPEPTVTCSPPSGSLFPPGAPQAVECLARDVKRNSCVCSFEVQVVDSTPPAIQCPPGPIVVDCAAGGEAGAVVSYPAPTATDLCDPEPIMVCDPPSGSLFPFGLTTVTCTAMDDAGNMARCTVDVMVVEDTPAQLLCQGDMTVACTGPEGATVEYPLPTATDSCRPPENLRCTPPPGSVFPLGRTTVLCSADVEGGGTITCSFNVTVSDTGRPSIQCPADMSVECGAPVAFNVTATDTCDPNPTVTCVPPPGSPFPPGRTVVNCTAVDAAGNSALCSFAVTVSDRTPPAITCPADMTVSCTTAGQPPHKPPGWPPGANPPPNPCNAVAEFAVPAARDDCDGAGLPVTCTPPSGTSLALGMHTVTCLARDAAGNESMCTFTVNVVRGEPAFIRGDANADGTIDIADAIFALNHLFLGSREPTCADTADANDNGEILLEDPILMINYQFMGGRAPNAPFLPVCGLDPTADDVGCGRYLPCE